MDGEMGDMNQDELMRAIGGLIDDGAMDEEVVEAKAEEDAAAEIEAARQAKAERKAAETARDAAPEDDGETEDDAEEEAIDEDNADEYADAKDAEDGKEAKAETFRVKVGDEEVEVTRDELLRGYTRQSDYTRNVQKVVEQRKALQAERAETARVTEAVVGLLKSFEPPAPTPEQMRTDPGLALEMNEARRQFGQQVGALLSAHTDMTQKAQREAKTARDEALKRGRAELSKLIPEWTDPEVRTRDKVALREFLQSRGFASSEVDTLADPRSVALARDAMLYRQLQSNRKTAAEKKVAAAPPMATAKTASKRGPGNSLGSAMDKLRQSGSVEDAAAALMRM